MKLGDIYKHKTNNELIQIESFANHINDANPFKTIIVFNYIQECGGLYGHCPSFNGYGSQEEIEEQYELFICQEDLCKYDSWEDIFNSIK